MREEKDKTAEHKLIDDIREWAGWTYIGDDCAVLPGQTLVTSDSLVEGTHFLLNLTGPRDLGWKAVAVNLSDIAAMGGRPRHLMVNVSMPPDFNKSEFRDLFLGMVDCASAYRTVIAGGDLTQAPVLVITITALGETHESGCLRRAGAQPGDVVAVTGDFGSSAAGLWLLRNDVAGFQHCKESHLRPKPRLCESWALVRHTGSRGALMDASDGLADSLVQIARMSKVGMTIDLSSVPVHPDTEAACKLAGLETTDWVLYGGEDYELVACIPPDIWQSWLGAPDNPFKPIGLVTDSPEVTIEGPDGQKYNLDLSKTYQHLSEPD